MKSKNNDVKDCFRIYVEAFVYIQNSIKKPSPEL